MWLSSMGLRAALILGRMPVVLDRLGTWPAGPEARVPAALMLMLGRLIRRAFAGLCWSGGESLDALASMLPPAAAAGMHALPASSAMPTAPASHAMTTCT